MEGPHDREISLLIGMLSVSLPTLEQQTKRTKAALERASEARRTLPPGSSRARGTSANARWMRAAEEHDRALAQEKLARDLHKAASTRSIATIVGVLEPT